MPANQAWRDEVESDTELDEDAIKEVESRLIELNTTIEKYNSPAWTEVFAELSEEQQLAFNVMMSTDDEKLLLTAREKARVLAGILNRKDRAAREFADLSHQRQILAGEVEEEE